MTTEDLDEDPNVSKQAIEETSEPVLLVDYRKQTEDGLLFVNRPDDFQIPEDSFLVEDKNQNLLQVQFAYEQDEVLYLKPDWETWHSPKDEDAPLASKVTVKPESALIYIDDIELLDNPRGDVGDISELAESIRVGGLLHPVVVRKTPPGSPKPFQLVVGYRRFNAHLFLKRKQIPALVHEFSHEDILAHLITENLQRKGWTAISEAQAMQRMIDVLGYSQSKVAALLGVHRSQVSRRLSLLNLPETVKEMVSDQSLSASHAEVLMSLKNTESQEELAQLTAKSGASVGKLNSWAQKVRQQEIEEEEALKWQEDQQASQTAHLESSENETTELSSHSTDSLEYQDPSLLPSEDANLPSGENHSEPMPQHSTANPDEQNDEQIKAHIYAEALMSEKTPIEQSFDQNLVASMPALKLSDWNEKDWKSAQLYMMLRSSNDKEALDYLEDEYEVTREDFWEFVGQRSIEEIDAMTRSLLRRWFSAPHRFPTFPEELKQDLGDGEVHIPPKPEEPDWEISVDSSTEFVDDWEDDWGDE